MPPRSYTCLNEPPDERASNEGNLTTHILLIDYADQKGLVHRITVIFE